jgi:hypothetical protein
MNATLKSSFASVNQQAEAGADKFLCSLSFFLATPFVPRLNFNGAGESGQFIQKPKT